MQRELAALLGLGVLLYARSKGEFARGKPRPFKLPFLPHFDLNVACE